MKDRPNIVIIYADQQRHDTIHALGSTGMHTPNLDRLVREGTSFTQATTTCPVCMPARWSLHCGQWTTTHQCYSNHHPGPQPVAHMPGLLRDAGYRTGLVVPVTAQGSNLLPYLEGTETGLRDTVFSEYGVPGQPYTPTRLREEGHSPGEFTNPGNPAIPWEGNPVSLSGRIRMARSQDWKLVQEEGGTNELYDLKNDPHELVNLSDAPVGKTAQAQLLRQLEDWKSSLPGIEIEAQQGVPSDA